MDNDHLQRRKRDRMLALGLLFHNSKGGKIIKPTENCVENKANPCQRMPTWGEDEALSQGPGRRDLSCARPLLTSSPWAAWVWAADGTQLCSLETLGAFQRHFCSMEMGWLIRGFFYCFLFFGFLVFSLFLPLFYLVFSTAPLENPALSSVVRVIIILCTAKKTKPTK